jgi:hypothetical protein
MAPTKVGLNKLHRTTYWIWRENRTLELTFVGFINIWQPEEFYFPAY